MDEKELIVLVQGHGCLYNLQHKDYDDNLVKDSSWKEIAGELHAQDKEISRRTQHCRRMAGSWQGKGMVFVNRPLMWPNNRMFVDSNLAWPKTLGMNQQSLRLMEQFERTSCSGICIYVFHLQDIQTEAWRSSCLFLLICAV
jgi:hypothetical protein